MKEGKTQVEINGRVIDAKTGKVVHLKHSRSSVVQKKTIDGFIKPKPSANRAKSRSVQPNSATDVHTKTQRTQRLHPVIRGPAKKTLEKARVIKRFTTRQAETSRAKRAVSHEKSHLIRRHDLGPTKESVLPQAQDEPIAPATPVVLPKRRPPAEKGKPTATKPVEHENVIPQQSWLRSHVIPAAASFASLALVSGFLIYNSLPTLTMRVAASRAGFNASVPNYQPSGFSFEGPISYGPGRVVIKFNSKTDDRSYTITQKESTWDSQSLLDNYVVEEADNYLTFQEHGLTVYLYDGSQATWVDDGIWYDVSGDANLNSEQLLKIASSL